MPFDYPTDLARAVATCWNHEERLPPLSRLTELLSCCYQASLLTEELHKVTFRLILVEPDESQLAPPWGHLCLAFDEPRPLHPGVLAKLSPVVEASSSLLGVRLGETGFEIWGLVNSGSRWASHQYSRRFPAEPPAGSLAVSVTAPGCLSVYDGGKLLVHLSGGTVRMPGPQVLASHWLQEMFLNIRHELEEIQASNSQSVEIDPKIFRTMTQTTLRRALDHLRLSGHGGILLIVPTEKTELFSAPNPYVNLNYRFADSGPRRLYRELLIRLIRRLDDLFPEASRISWADYRACQDAQMSELDEAFENFSHTLAGLLSMDGAVIMTQRLELLGFGAEIAGNLPPVLQVQAALDVEAEETRSEETAGVGTRHRSVYRLCAQLPWLLGLVQSQDGRIRMVKQHRDQVTYWDQFGFGSDMPRS